MAEYEYNEYVALSSDMSFLKFSNAYITMLWFQQGVDTHKVPLFPSGSYLPQVFISPEPVRRTIP